MAEMREVPVHLHLDMYPMMGSIETAKKVPEIRNQYHWPKPLAVEMMPITGQVVYPLKKDK